MRRPLTSIASDELARSAPECRYLVTDGEGRVVLAGQVSVSADASFSLDFSSKLPSGHFTLIAQIIVNGKSDAAGLAGDETEVAVLAEKILQMIAKEPLYYTDIAERFSAYDFRTVARALGHLHASEKLWQDPRGRMCVRGSQFAAKPPRG